MLSADQFMLSAGQFMLSADHFCRPTSSGNPSRNQFARLLSFFLHGLYFNFSGWLRTHTISYIYTHLESTTTYFKIQDERVFRWFFNKNEFSLCWGNLVQATAKLATTCGKFINSENLDCQTQLNDPSAVRQNIPAQTLLPPTTKKARQNTEHTSQIYSRNFNITRRKN